MFAFLLLYRGSYSKGHWINWIKVVLSRFCFQVFFQLFDQKGLLLVWIQSRQETVQSQQRMQTHRGESRRFLVLQKRTDQLNQQVRPNQACSTNTAEPISEKLGPFWAKLNTANTSYLWHELSTLWSLLYIIQFFEIFIQPKPSHRAAIVATTCSMQLRNVLRGIFPSKFFCGLYIGARDIFWRDIF